MQWYQSEHESANDCKFFLFCFSNFSIHFKIDQGVQPRFLINPQLNNKLNDDDRHIAIIQCRVM